MNGQKTDRGTLAVGNRAGLGSWIKDGLLLQILMLIFPVEAIKLWQMCR